MLWSEPIKLVAETFAYDEVGNPVGQTTQSSIYANEMKMNSNDIAIIQDAGFSGFAEIHRFEIWAHDYNGQMNVELKGKTLSVISVQPRGEKVWITCRREVSDG